jgi:tonB-linked outer membrane protein, susC/ragA family
MAALEARRYDKTEHPDRPWIVVAPYKGKDIYNYYGNWDWWHFLYKDWMPSHSHSINMSGGTDKVNYMISGSYYNKKGMLKKNTEDYQSFTLTTKINVQLTPWLKITNNVQYFDKKYTYPGMEGETNENWQNVNVHALPCYAPMNPDGTFTYNTMKNSYSIADGRIANLLSDVSKGKKGVHELKETLALEATITKDLKFKADYTFQFYMADDWYRRGKEYYSIQPGVLQEIPNFNTDYYKKTIWYDPMHVANAYLSFDKSIKDHSFGFTGGINYENKKHHRVMGQKYDLISNTLNDLNLGTGEALATGGQYEYELFGAFFRVNYDYKDRYLIEVNGRYDGTSKYKSGKRFGFFPSVSAGWRISEEEWFAPANKYVENLKIRASYGTLGNQLSGSNYYPYISAMSATQSNWLIDGKKSYNVGVPNPVSENLTWEKATTINLGLDFNVLNNRLSFTGDYYVRNTTDMLVNGLSLPGVFGASSPKQNAGDLRTKGFELTIAWNDNFTLGKKPFSYGASFTLGDATSEITRYEANAKGLISTYYVGKKIGEIWGYRTDGLFQSDEEATQYNQQVNQRYVNNRIYKSPGDWGKPKAGDVKFLDLDGNGKIHPGASTLDNHGDLEIIGNTTPRFNYGFSMNASWNGIDFSAFFQGIMHQDFYPGSDMDRFWGPYSRPYYSFIPADFAKDVWSEDNKDAYFPQPRGYAALDGNCQLSVKNDRYLQNLGYLRMKNLVVGYTLPFAISKKACIEKLRFYASAENLFYLTAFRSNYIDPEQAASTDTGRIYPLSKTFSVGVNVTF